MMLSGVASLLLNSLTALLLLIIIESVGTFSVTAHTHRIEYIFEDRVHQAILYTAEHKDFEFSACFTTLSLALATACMYFFHFSFFRLSTNRLIS